MVSESSASDSLQSTLSKLELQTQPEGASSTVPSLPDGWARVSLDAVTHVTSGGPAPQGDQYFGGANPFVRVQHLDEESHTIQKWDLITDEAVQKYRLRLFPKGTIVFPKSGASIRLEKRAVLPVDAYVVSHLCALLPKPDVVDGTYLFCALRALRFADQKAEGYPTLGLQEVKATRVSLAPLNEQRRIARVLGTIQKAIEAQEKVIAAARELKRSLLKHLFTYGPVPVTETSRVPLKETRIGSVPEHWEVIRLGEACDFLQYGTSKRCDSDRTGLPVLRIPNVVSGDVDTNDLKFIHLDGREAERIKLRPGDLLFVRTNATRENVGCCTVFRREPKGALFASYLIRVQLKDGTLIPDFMHLYAMTESGKRYLSGMASGAADGKFNINTQTIRAVIVPRPPAREQRKIVLMVKTVVGKIDAEENRKAALQTLFKTMLHHLMTGKIRVREDI